MIAEQAGGGATTGKRRVMEIFPDNIHQRVPFAIGSLQEIEEYKKAYSESCRVWRDRSRRLYFHLSSWSRPSGITYTQEIYVIKCTLCHNEAFDVDEEKCLVCGHAEEVLKCRCCKEPYIFSSCEYGEEAQLCPSCEYKDGYASANFENIKYNLTRKIHSDVSPIQRIIPHLLWALNILIE